MREVSKVPILAGAALAVRGGAYNCRDSGQLHQCGYVADWGPLAIGFRCCSDGD